MSIKIWRRRGGRAGIFRVFLRQPETTNDQEGASMTATAWEAFIARLLGLGVNAVQGLIRIALIIALAYAATQLLRAGLARLEHFLINATARIEDTALATSKRIKTLSSVIWTLSAGLLWFL